MLWGFFFGGGGGRGGGRTAAGRQHSAGPSVGRRSRRQFSRRRRLTKLLTRLVRVFGATALAVRSRRAGLARWHRSPAREGGSRRRRTRHQRRCSCSREAGRPPGEGRGRGPSAALKGTAEHGHLFASGEEGWRGRRAEMREMGSGGEKGKGMGGVCARALVARLKEFGCSTHSRVMCCRCRCRCRGCACARSEVAWRRGLATSGRSGGKQQESARHRP
jgi:hypothetical protein